MIAPLDLATLPVPAQKILSGPPKLQEMAAKGVAIGVGPGDLVLFGTAPDTPKTSTGVAIVTEVLADGRLKVIGGDYKGTVAERTVALKGIYGWVDA